LSKRNALQYFPFASGGVADANNNVDGNQDGSLTSDGREHFIFIHTLLLEGTDSFVVSTLEDNGYYIGKCASVAVQQFGNDMSLFDVLKRGEWWITHPMTMRVANSVIGNPKNLSNIVAPPSTFTDGNVFSLSRYMIFFFFD